MHRFRRQEGRAVCPRCTTGKPSRTVVHPAKACQRRYQDNLLLEPHATTSTLITIQRIALVSHRLDRATRAPRFLLDVSLRQDGPFIRIPCPAPRLFFAIRKRADNRIPGIGTRAALITVTLAPTHQTLGGELSKKRMRRTEYTAGRSYV